MTLYVMVIVDWLIDAEADPDALNPCSLLEADPRFAGMRWRTQRSGVRIPDAVAEAVEAEARLGACGDFLLPTETKSAEQITEGARKTVTVDVRERSAKARLQAIALHGASCTVCGFTFADFYGEIGDGYIEVHHLDQLADAEGEHVVDPATDLRPVCPNCHAMLHWKVATPREIEDVQERVAGQVGQGRVAFSWFKADEGV